MRRSGPDGPDTRFALELFDAGDVFRGADFGITKAALEQGGRVRGIRIPGGASLSRKQVDEIEADAKKAGAMGLLRLKFVGGALEGGPLAKVLSPESVGAFGVQDGDLVLFVAGPDRVSSAALDRVR